MYKRIGLGVNKNLKATFPTYFSAVNPGKMASMALAASAVLPLRRRHRRRYEAWQAALRLSRAARHDHLEAAYDEVHHDHLEAAYDEVHHDHPEEAYDEVHHDHPEEAYDEVHHDHPEAACDEVHHDHLEAA